MKLVFTPVILSGLVLLIVPLLVAGESTAIYSPIDNIRLNCGDINSKFFLGVGGTSRVLNASSSPSSVDKVPFTTARLSYSEFTYRFPVSPGQKFIRLYFFSADYTADFARSNSLFSVKAGGYILLKDYNASLSSTNSYRSEWFFREYCIKIEAEERSLDITFNPRNGGYAFINGIGIMSMPTNLYHSAEGASYLGNAGNTYYVNNNTALETLFRINVGGDDISPDKDTGMYRTWSPADKFFLNEQSYDLSSVLRNQSIDLVFSNISSYTAPQEVYRTARVIGENISKSYNLTWDFPVDPHFSYLVRLHFCEIESGFTEPRDRMFQVFIANLTAEPYADVVLWTGGNGIPIYKDYYLPMPSLGTQKKGQVNLSVALQANQDEAETRHVDVLLNGLEIFKLNDTDGNLNEVIPDLPLTIPPHVTPESSKKKKSTPMLALLAGVVSGLLVLSVVGFLLFRRGRKVKHTSATNQSTKWDPLSFATTKSTKSRGSRLPSDLCRHFSLAEIKAATQDFDEVLIIGSGGFGNVYKGYIDDGSTPVAIKRLKPESSQGVHEFKNEIEMLSQLRHMHLVSLIGFCTEQGEMILVYDYMTNGTLRHHLYKTENPPLPWEQRLQICTGAARGLHYLHTGAKYMIIHRDVKSTNILLDEKWVAKVSDFGLSKMGTTTMSKTHISTMVKGSFGYLDPEYYRRQQLTEKSDVYSFGVVLCEVLCARPALLRTVVDKKQMSLAEWTKTSHRNGTISEIIDPHLRGKIAAASLDKFVELAVSCMNENGNERPSMNDVVWGLEFVLQLQQSAEPMPYSDFKKDDKDEVALMKGNDAGFSCSWEYSSDLKTSRTTNSSSQENSTTNESIKGMSGTVFSEIRDPTVR